MKIAVSLLALASVALAAPHHHDGSHGAEEKTNASAANMNIIELAEKLGATTLVDLVKKAGLSGILSGEGPFTVFGPTNQAFENLPTSITENATLVKNILMYHVVMGVIYSSALSNNLIAQSVLPNESIRINLYSHGEETVATAEGSRIILADQNASNGVIHVVNRVMLPPLFGTMAGFLDSEYGKDFSTLLVAFKAAGLTEFLSSDGPFTVFTPTNRAFAKIPNATLDGLLKNKTQLTKVLTYHAVAGAQWSAGLYNEEEVKTVEGSPLTIHVEGGPGHRPEIDIIFGMKKSARVTYADVPVTNGVIHVIDTVMLPPDL